ncbi:ABC transporter substrate-binding protein [Sneathiella sp.]|uniref:ABC transporter substrate-binding protein n=1 Tax=Sneathiella sp. TaxID=1964365 RepID=UPI0039E61B2B
MKLIKKIAVAVATVAIGVSALTAAVPVQAKTNSVTYAMYGDIKDWDPSEAFSLEVMMLVNVYEPLLWYNPPGSEQQFTPALAESWKVSEDGLTWTFNLRQGVKFHDGEPLTAEAAKSSIERTRKLKKGAYYIWGAVSSIEAPETHTLVIKTKEPAPIDLIASSQYGAYIYSPKAAEKGAEWFNQGNAAGTGPYTVRQWKAGQQIVLDKNPDYWGGFDESNFERIYLKVVTENATQVQMLKAGEADFISLVPADQVDSLNNEPGITAKGVPSWKNSQFLINTQKAPTDNKKFRQALTMLWDYDKVVKEIYAGYAEPGKGVVPATMWGHNSNIKTPVFDVEKAKKLVDESGVPADQRKVTMAYIGTSEEYKNSALLFQANAAKAGIEVELKPGKWGAIWKNAKDLRTAPNLQSMTWWPTYPTPNDWMIGLFRTEEKALFNLSHYANSAYDKLVDEGAALEGSDRDAAVAKYAKAQKLLMEDATAIFYADIKGRVAYRSNIVGLQSNPAYAGIFFHRLKRAAQ